MTPQFFPPVKHYGYEIMMEKINQHMWYIL